MDAGSRFGCIRDGCIDLECGPVIDFDDPYDDGETLEPYCRDLDRIDLVAALHVLCCVFSGSLLPLLSLQLRTY